MAGRATRRSGRALKALVVLGLAAGAFGTWAPAAGTSTAAAAAGTVSTEWPAGLLSPVAADPATLRLQLPPGYDTEAARAARAARTAAEAAEAAAAAKAAAAAEAAAAAKTATRSAAASPRTSPSARRESAVPPAAAPTGLPLGVDPGSSTQVVTVVAPSARSTTAALTAWQRGPGGWAAVLGPVTAHLGSAGVGRASETSTRTPAGTFTLTEAFGRAGDPGTALPYRVVDGDDWWVSDVSSPQYNRYARCRPGSCPFDERVSENLYAAGGVYDYAVVIDYNRGGTPGAGSAFFLHVTNNAPTAGCVAIDAGTLVTLLQWLDPGARPLIAIGVG